MNTLSRADRLRLMKFVCSFAWTDLVVSEAERELVSHLASHHDFDDADRKQIDEWLKVPPPAEELDPTQIPIEHRQLFLDAARAVVQADGRLAGEEREQFALFEELVKSSS